MNKKIQVWLPLLISIAVIAGMLIGYRLRDTQPGKRFFSFDKPRPLQEVMNLIQNKYVDEVKITALSDSAIIAVLHKLDPHSVFIPSEELQGVNEDIAGNFFGVGIEFNIFEDTLHVLNVIPGGPSFKAGIKIGDKFIQVNDSVIAGKKITTDQVRKLLRGDLGTKAVVQVVRKGNQQSFTIVRGVIPVSSVDASYIIGNGIGFIRLNKFSQVSYREFMQALEDLQKKGLKKLILDLRGNGGGVLDEATAIADEFLDGDKLITYTLGNHMPKREYRCQREGLFEKGELVLLADEGSASASEVLMGALQDWDRCTIIGRRSFGKGLVQEQYDLSDGSALRLTVARYYTPIGRSIQRSYTNGEKAYYEEINNRFRDGEVMSADSVKNDTSKIFATRNGKKVYGGGGITPDIFIPVDTTSYNASLTKIYIKGTTSDFAYHYYLQNAAQLSGYISPGDFSKNFTVTDEIWKQFTIIAAKDSIVLTGLNEKDKKGLAARIKSALARQIWRNEGFYEIMNEGDNTVKKAIEILSK
ncbi:MAG: S41 family peptidase [Ferruginibacter sp.]|nr:S41 family peptidase [Ferruginibacter sp.]